MTREQQNELSMTDVKHLKSAFDFEPLIQVRPVLAALELLTIALCSRASRAYIDALRFSDLESMMVTACHTLARTFSHMTMPQQLYVLPNVDKDCITVEAGEFTTRLLCIRPQQSKITPQLHVFKPERLADLDRKDNVFPREPIKS